MRLKEAQSGIQGFAYPFAKDRHGVLRDSNGRRPSVALVNSFPQSVTALEKAVELLYRTAHAWGPMLAEDVDDFLKEMGVIDA